LVGAESAGVPLPGEAALIAAAVLAHSGELRIELVIPIAAVAAIVGDNIGYMIGRRGGRALLLLPGPFRARRERFLEQGEPFFERHGPKAVFLGRWTAVLRIAVAWLAGAHRMRWSVFSFWNALGAIAWASVVGVLAYLLGPVVEHFLAVFGLASAVVGAALVFGLLTWRRRSAV
jgi:membrane protein DedA with SNARE-associated domain